MKRSKFSLSNYKLLSCNMGELVPIGLTEVLPGDTFQHATSLVLRVSPLLAPVMHPVHVRVHHWFVPNRLVWDNWEPFITGGPDGMDASVYPYIDFAGPGTEGSLADYLGIAPLFEGEVSALPFRGYGLIWNEWYRDQDLQTELTVSKADGADSTTNRLLQNPCWEKDYFTAARPWTQKGPEITIPVGDSDIVSKTGVGNAALTRKITDDTLSGTFQHNSSASSALTDAGGTQDYYIDPNGTLRTDFANGDPGTINELREAFAIQRYEEARARYGSRYVEYLRYLGVRSSDARLQRPEYLGGGSQTIQFSEVLQTAEGTDPVGELRGHGISSMRSNRYRRFFEEHGYVFSLLSVRPKTVYNQATHRTWFRRSKEDYFQKELQFVGQQEIYKKELYAGIWDDTIFGYGDRYDEYRREPSTVAGEFRTTDLNYWHMARDFSSTPSLNSDFVKLNPTNRIYASTTKDQLYIMAKHSIQTRRLVSKNATPRLY